jgi:hypothetical protein
MLNKIIYGPPDWLVTKFSSRDRRAFGFWTLIIAAVAAIFFGRTVLYVSIVSVLALIPNFSSETPVEEEDGDQAA